MMAHYYTSGIPISGANGSLAGILTNRDLRFEDDLDRPIHELMTQEDLIAVPVGTTWTKPRESCTVIG
jgi:IMP dehydrogenase